MQPSNIPPEATDPNAEPPEHIYLPATEKTPGGLGSIHCYQYEPYSTTYDIQFTKRKYTCKDGSTGVAFSFTIWDYDHVDTEAGTSADVGRTYRWKVQDGLTQKIPGIYFAQEMPDDAHSILYLLKICGHNVSFFA